MTPIKFRAWDKTRKEFQYFVITPTKEQLQENVISFGSPIHQHLLEHGDIDGSYQQYTGLKEKNGKEIYEGDLLHYKGAHSQIGEVIYHDGMFKFSYQDNWGVISLWNESSEIIGNIYENPEFL